MSFKTIWKTGALFALLGLQLSAHAAPLVIAIAEFPLFAPMQIADSEGYFKAEGLDVRIQPCVNGRRCLKHLTDGEAQVAAVADTPLVFAVHAGLPFEIIATTSVGARDTMLVARTDRGILSVQDLKGKRVGTFGGTTAHFFISNLLLVAGLPRDSVTVVMMDPERGFEPLLKGEVDAASLYRPLGPLAVQQLGAKVRALDVPRAFTSSSNLVAQPGLPQDTLLRLLKAVARATALMNNSPAQARQVLAARWKQDAQQVDKQLSGYEFRLTLDQNLLLTLEAESRWALRDGLVNPNSSADFLSRLRVEPLRTLNPQAVSIIK